MKRWSEGVGPGLGIAFGGRREGVGGWSGFRQDGGFDRRFRECVAAAEMVVGEARGTGMRPTPADLVDVRTKKHYHKDTKARREVAI